MDKLYIIKIGGHIVDDEARLARLLTSLAGLEERFILVHGGGKLATRLAEQLSIPQKMVDGRRITDAETLKVVTMVYAGLINKQLVAALQARNIKAVGMSGADGNLVLARKREKAGLDYGFAGDIVSVNNAFILMMLEQDFVPVVAPITHDGHGQLLNTNADTMASELAAALASHFETHLVFSFEKKGVMLDLEDESSLIGRLNHRDYLRLREEGRIFSGMLPKMDNAFAAMEAGVARVIIGPAEDLDQLLAGRTGTSLAND